MVKKNLNPFKGDPIKLEITSKRKLTEEEETLILHAIRYLYGGTTLRADLPNVHDVVSLMKEEIQNIVIDFRYHYR